jgi:hypothetical protein
MAQIETILKRLEDYVSGTKIIDNVLLGVNRGEFEIKKRIFNDTDGAKDVKGVKAGIYSNPYKKVRAKKGQQVRVKDFTDETDLLKSIKTVRKDNIVKIVIFDDFNSNKAKHLTIQTKKKAGTGAIFSTSRLEVDKIKKTISKLVINDINKILGND